MDTHMCTTFQHYNNYIIREQMYEFWAGKIRRTAVVAAHPGWRSSEIDVTMTEIREACKQNRKIVIVGIKYRMARKTEEMQQHCMAQLKILVDRNQNACRP